MYLWRDVKDERRFYQRAAFGQQLELLFSLKVFQGFIGLSYFFPSEALRSPHEQASASSKLVKLPVLPAFSQHYYRDDLSISGQRVKRRPHPGSDA